MLPECLESIKKNNPEARVVAVDGAYKSFIEENKKQIALCIERGEKTIADQLMRFTVVRSPDKTVEILKSAGAEVIEPTEFDESTGDFKPWDHEYIKRNKYLVGKDGDYYFVIDADERLVNRIEMDSLQKDAYNVMIERDDNTVPYPILRIFKHSPGIHYAGAHHAIFINDILQRAKNVDNLPGAKLAHAHVIRIKRDPMRALAKGAYYRHLTGQEEAAFRTQYGL